MPPRSVKVRVRDRFNRICQCGCGVTIVGDKGWDTDHHIPISQGGENRETNLKPLLNACHKIKTAREAGVRAKTNQVRFKHLGLKTKSSGRGWPCGRNSKFKRTIGGKVVPRT